MSDTTGMGSDRDSNADTKNGNCTLPVTLQRRANTTRTLDAGIYQPTAVLLSDFSVTANGNALRISWRTLSEINTFGFGVYRSQTANRSDAVLITNELISAKGGGSYVVHDATADIGKRYSYWLQEIEQSGAINEYGPATYTPQVSVAASAGGVPVAGAAAQFAQQNVAPNIVNKPMGLVAETNPQNVAVVAQVAANVSTSGNTGSPAVGAVEVARTEPGAQLEAPPAVAPSAPANVAPTQEQANAQAVTQAQLPSTQPAQTEVRVSEPKNIHQAQVGSRPVERATVPATSTNLSTWLIVIVLSMIACAVAGAVLGLAVWVGRRRE